MLFLLNSLFRLSLLPLTFPISLLPLMLVSSFFLHASLVLRWGTTLEPEVLFSFFLLLFFYLCPFLPVCRCPLYFTLIFPLPPTCALLLADSCSRCNALTASAQRRMFLRLRFCHHQFIYPCLHHWRRTRPFLPPQFIFYPSPFFFTIVFLFCLKGWLASRTALSTLVSSRVSLPAQP